jgi:hypothetical protein
MKKPLLRKWFFNQKSRKELHEHTVLDFEPSMTSGSRLRRRRELVFLAFSAAGG